MIVPTFFTFLNLFTGFGSIIASSKGRLETAAWLIVLSMILDYLDGRVARVLRKTSELGIQMDSLVDVVSFGVAPAFLLYVAVFRSMEFPFAIVPFVYLVSVIMRLARFNLWVENISKGYYPGLSSPASAALLSSLIVISKDMSFPFPREYYIFVVIILSFFMLSKIRYPSFKGEKTSEKVQTLLFLSAVALTVVFKFYAIFAISLVYMLTGVVSLLFEKKNSKNEPGENRSAD